MDKKKIVYILILVGLLLKTTFGEALVLPYKVHVYEGYQLFRDSEESQVFYYLPRYFHLQYDTRNRPAMSHAFFDRVEQPFSFYKFVLVASSPDTSDRLKIANLIRQQENINPRVEPAPISDMFMKLPRMESGPFKAALSFMVSDWEDGMHPSIADISQPISFAVTADQQLEPTLANLMMKEGIIFPPIKVKLKGKFTPKKAMLRYHQEKIHNYFAATTNGTYRLFNWDLKHDIETLKKSKALFIDVECDLPDPASNSECNAKLEQSLIDLFREQQFREVLNFEKPELKQPAGIGLFSLAYSGRQTSDEEWVTIDIHHTAYDYFNYDVEPLIRDLSPNCFDPKIFHL